MVEYPIKIEVKYEEKASRLEALIIRWLYAILFTIAIMFWGIAVTFATIALWLYILVYGKRHIGLFNFCAGYFRFYTRVTGYLCLLTDERPAISGD